MDKKLIKEFRNPGSQYRGAPFWAWNGKLEPDELRRQIRIMHRMGLGGFFMHSRVGLNTAYLSKEWFEAVNACIDEAEKLDMQAWLYDEDRWPSGAAGGLVTKNPKHRMRSLKVDVLDKPAALKWTPETLAVFTARLDKHMATNVKRLAKGSRPRTLAKGESILRCHVAIDDCSDWYNGYTYLDTLSHEAVREFIKVTHEAYRKNIGRHFGGRVPGIFTDEPNYGHTLGLPWSKPKLEVPWTPKLPQVFRRRYGYDLIPRLLEVFFDVDGVEVTPARWQYHDCITHLFVDAFNRQIGEWCEKHNMQYTGHMLAEETLSSQTAVVGNTLRSYEYMQAPGMDILTEHSRQYDTAKQVSSVARQFGRKWRLTETYGCTGWDFPFVGHKAVGDWQAALGINLRCQHLSWYTMEGQAKRDYPAGIFYQSPWWELYPKVEDYFARVHAVMTRGAEVRDLLEMENPGKEYCITTFKIPGDLPDAFAVEIDLLPVKMLPAVGESTVSGPFMYNDSYARVVDGRSDVMNVPGLPSGMETEAARGPVDGPALTLGRWGQYRVEYFHVGRLQTGEKLYEVHLPQSSNAGIRLSGKRDGAVAMSFRGCRMLLGEIRVRQLVPPAGLVTGPVHN